jgi:hypothetical protein
MDRQWRLLGILLVAASVSQGCVSVHAPLVADDDYPRSWGELSTLGPECKSLEGTYQNEGVATAASGVTQPLLLTSVLNIRSNARTLSLSVRTRSLDQNGDAFITLRVAPDDNIADARELEGCFCIKRTLACTQVSESYWSVPNFGLGGSQKNVYFSLLQDRSLVAKLQNYHADVILMIPVFGMREPWAMFNRADR